MAAPIVSDALWAKVEPRLPAPKPRRFDHPGRKPLAPRAARTGILFVLRTGLRWNDLPREMGCGSGRRCRRRLTEWHAAGVWARRHALLLAERDAAGKVDGSRAAVDASHVRARGGGSKTGPSPVDRGRNGSKHHAVVDPHGVPPAATTTAADVPDVTALPEVVDAVPLVRRRNRDRPRHRPKRLSGDRGSDSDPHRRRMRARGIRPPFARRRTPHGSGPGVHRWMVERFFRRLHRDRRFRVRTDRDCSNHDALLSLALSLICFNML